jgi:hypothetical protein
MCRQCIEEYCDKMVINAEVLKVSKLVTEIYSYSCIGANCHIVLDDCNIFDDHIISCLEEIKGNNFHKSTPEQLKIEKECMDRMLLMSKDERYAVLAIHDGYLEVNL